MQPNYSIVLRVSKSQHSSCFFEGDGPSPFSTYRRKLKNGASLQTTFLSARIVYQLVNSCGVSGKLVAQKRNKINQALYDGIMVYTTLT